MTNKNDLSQTALGADGVHNPIAQSHSPPKTDVEESSDYFLLSMEILNIPQDHLRIEVIDNKELLAWGDAEDHRRSFERVFLIPRSADVNRIEATYEEGILHIVLPKLEHVAAKIIPIGGEKKSKILDRIRQAVGFPTKPAEKIA